MGWRDAICSLENEGSTEDTDAADREKNPIALSEWCSLRCTMSRGCDGNLREYEREEEKYI